MGIDSDRRSSSDPPDEDIDWEEYAYRKTQEEKPQIPLDLTDYAALFLASLQTIFLPLVVLTMMLFVIGLYLGVFF